MLLAENFPGSDELRAQARTVRVKGFWEDRPSIVLLEVMDPGAPRANVVHAVPVEAKVRDADPPQELLLFVKDGLLDSIELVDYAGNDAVGAARHWRSRTANRKQRWDLRASASRQIATAVGVIDKQHALPGSARYRADLTGRNGWSFV